MSICNRQAVRNAHGIIAIRAYLLWSQGINEKDTVCNFCVLDRCIGWKAW